MAGYSKSWKIAVCLALCAFLAILFLAILFGCGESNTGKGASSGGSTHKCYLDADADTYGDPFVSTGTDGEGCPAGWVEDNTDCNDSNPEVNPGIVEGPSNRGSCFDGLDNNCDGVADVADEDCHPIIFGRCADEPPAGVELPAPPPDYPYGECPQIRPGRNTIKAGNPPGSMREFLLLAPEDLDPAEKLPVVFMWHWLAGSAAEFAEKGDVQTAVNKMRFLAVIPEAKGDLLFTWPFLLFDSQRRINDELLFFDHMLACISRQYNVNLNCVSSVGVSAGGAWTTYLAHERSRHLASFISLSGGTGHPDDPFNPVQYWSHAEHILPALVLWGGPFDWCGLSFAMTSNHLEDYLTEDGHFFVECIHNCQHAEPPSDEDAQTKYAFLWNFIFDHPYWLEDGKSPYLYEGLPDTFPYWCGIGDGSATIREGECESGLFGDCF